MNDDDMQRLLAEAAAARAADIDRLAELDEDQLYYLAHVGDIPDPVTDGKSCAPNDEVAAAIESLTQWKIDGRELVVQLVPDQSAPPIEVWTTRLERPTSAESLPFEVMAELKLALEAGGHPPPYYLDTRRSYAEWGASAINEVVLLVVSLGFSGVVGNAAYAALLTTVKRLALAARDDRYPTRALDHQEAEERGRWAVRSAFDLTYDDADRLVPVAAERAGERWLIRYRLADRHYEVELLEDDGLVTIARAGWTNDD